MRIPLDRQGQTPLYQQIEHHLRESILSGSLAAGTRLPACRQLAQDLGVNRLTVENAYSGLEADGLVFARVGSGTYVLPPSPVQPVRQSRVEATWPLWQESLLSKNIVPKAGLPDEMLRQAGHPHPISFAGGVSDARQFPAEEFRKVLQGVMRRDGMEALEYGERSGYGPLRAGIAHILAAQGLQVAPEHILVTAGSQAAIALVAQVLLKPDDVILVENPTYSIAIDLFKRLGFQVVGIPMDGQGMQVEKLETLLQQHHPKLIYTIPNFHNPTGTCLSGRAAAAVDRAGGAL